VLIEKISEAVGGIAKPYQMKRVAKAHAEVKLIEAQSKPPGSTVALSYTCVIVISAVVVFLIEDGQQRSDDRSGSGPRSAGVAGRRGNRNSGVAPLRDD
jgi:hypothetical protein